MQFRLVLIRKNVAVRKFMLVPKLNAENMGETCKVIMCVLQQLVFSLLRGLLKCFTAAFCDGLQHIIEGSLFCQSL